MELLIAFAVALGVNILMFIPAFIFKTDKLTDVSYGLSFILVAGLMMLFAEHDMTLAHYILFGIITLWGIRIATYLLVRIWKIGRDKRFDDKRDFFWKFLGFWVIQGTTVFVVLLAAIQYFLTPNTELSTITILGAVIALLGLAIETFADYQKYTFINDTSNAGKWIDTGLWKYSRHPNYFGEMMFWIGIYIFTIPVMSGYMYLVGALSPIYIIALIMFVSGIPLLEKMADERWGDNPDYQNYKKTTSSLILLPKKG